jgi:hypothetical protein
MAQLLEQLEQDGVVEHLELQPGMLTGSLTSTQGAAG